MKKSVEEQFFVERHNSKKKMNLKKGFRKIVIVLSCLFLCNNYSQDDEADDWNEGKTDFPTRSGVSFTFGFSQPISGFGQTVFFLLKRSIQRFQLLRCYVKLTLGLSFPKK